MFVVDVLEHLIILSASRLAVHRNFANGKLRLSVIWSSHMDHAVITLLVYD